MPGVLVIEALAQLASILAWKMPGRTPGDGTLIFFAGIDDARFSARCVPGDQLMLESEVQRVVRGIGKFAVRAKVDGEIVAEANCWPRCACRTSSQSGSGAAWPRIHPTALVDPKAELAADVEVGAYSIVGPGVRIGRGHDHRPACRR